MPEFIILFFLFLVGTVFGSFIDVMSSRTASGKSFLMSRSQCQKCLKEIWPIDLIPLVSYLLLGGKCRFCKHKIPFRLFFIELLTGLLFMSAYLLTSLPPLTFVLLLLILSLFIAIFLSDMRFGVIPDQFLAALGFFSLFYVLLQGDTLMQGLTLIAMHVLAGFVAFGLFFAVFYLTRGRGMGFGDVKFSFLIGFLLSFKLMIVAFYIAFLTGAVISLILIVLGKKKIRGDTIPFGPFLVLGVTCTLLFEMQVIGIVRLFFGI